MRYKITAAVIVLVLIASALAFGQAPKPTVTPKPTASPSPSPTPSPTPSPAVSPSPAPSPAAETEAAVPGTKEQKLNQYKKVTGRENWDYTYDVSDLDKGMYNIIIEATDRAGNIYYSNPVNVLIDPESDLPVVSLTNPVTDMRVGGSVLNIVGTCADDDAVAKVEVSIDGGEFKAAEGKDFWSYKLTTEGMEDGPHAIAVRGVDVNGVSGQEVSRRFHLDTKKPLTELGSHKSGAILSGVNELVGSVQDLNDITSFSYSDDNAKTWKQVNLSYKTEEKKYYFKISIDTKRIPDGPTVCWFKGLDKTGSVGLAAFLFFVDNTKPTLEIVSPKKDSKLNGKFYVIGKVHDAIGIKSLAYKHREKTSVVALIPGNPYWFVELDTTAYATTAETIEFTVTDTVNNTVQVPVKIDIDQNADKPVVTLASPADKAVLSGDADVVGFVADDDAGKDIVYTIDGKEAVTVPAAEAFSFRLAALDPGKHTLAVQAVDVNGVKGDKKTVEFSVMGRNAVVSINQAIDKETARPFVPGVETGRFDKTVLRGTISEYEKFKRVRYTIDGSEEKDLPLRAAGADKFLREFDISIPDTVPYGLVNVKIIAVDAYDRVTEFQSFIHVTHYGKLSARPGIYLADARLDAGSAAISVEHPLEAFFIGDKVKTITTEPSLASVRAVEVDGRITVAPVGTLAVETVKLKVTTVNNETFYSPEITFTGAEEYFTDPLRRVRLGTGDRGGAPSFYPGQAIASPDGQTKIDGVSASETARVEVSFDNKTFRAADYRRSKDQPTSPFSFTVPKELPFGYNEVFLRVADDKKGIALFRSFFFKIDPAGKTNPDDPGLYFPESGADNTVTLRPNDSLRGYVNGREVKSVTLKPASPLLKASFSGNTVIVEAAGEGRTAPVTIEVVTVNGQTYASKPFIFLTDARAPELAVTAPTPGAWVGKSFTLEGTATDGTGIQTLEYRFNAAETWTKLAFGARKVEIKDKSGKPTGRFETMAASEGSFSQIIDLAAVAEGDLTVSVRALDQAGNSAVLPLALKKDTIAPTIGFITPEPGVKVNGAFSVAGTTADAGRTARIEFSPDGKTWEQIPGTAEFTFILDLARWKTPPEKFYFRAGDATGNASVANPAFAIDFESDKPRTEIQVPAKGEVIRNDFIISGMVFDDDGVKTVFYRLDGKEYVKIDGASSFNIPVRLADIADNEHKLEMYAEDLGGIKGDVITSTFYVSKAEPVSFLATPPIETTAKGRISLAGTANDENGIKSVSLSFDNGNTWQEAVGKDKWSYSFDTALLSDGVHRILIRAFDTTDTQGLSATLMHVDNTLPMLSLDRPAEGETVTDTLVLDGRAFDNIVLKRLTVNVAAVNQTGGDTAGREYDLPLGGVFVKQIDMGKMKEGWYNLRIEARDKADNITYLTRNVRVEQKKLTNRVEQVFPQDGDTVAGRFVLCGRVISELAVKAVSLAIDGKERPVEINAFGYYRLPFAPEEIGPGEHVITVTASLADGSTIASEKYRLTVRARGPWVDITSLATGDFIARRPWLKGEAGYFLPSVSREDKEAFAAYEKELNENRIEKVEISFNSGRTFTIMNGQDSWLYRLQTQDIPDGLVRILVRATTLSGQTAVVKALVSNDDQPPTVKTLLPEEGQKFNDKISVLGIATDENGLTDVRINLRRGDKSGYKIPEFIQGMYLDFQARTIFTGTVSWAVGFGLTFFDQNVKLQVQVGFEPESRFDGLLLGVKLLANIFKLPFESLLGPDWEFFSMSLSLGANFSYCTNSGDVIEFTESGRMLAAAVAQLEFAKFSISEWSSFNAYSLYTEFNLWFLSTDVPGAPVVEPKIMFGLRVQLF